MLLAGLDASIKRLYEIDLGFCTNDCNYTVPEGSTLTKTLVRDIIPDLQSWNGPVPEKVEGLAVTTSGQVYFVNDNEAVDNNSGETLLVDLGVGAVTVATYPPTTSLPTPVPTPLPTTDPPTPFPSEQPSSAPFAATAIPTVVPTPIPTFVPTVLPTAPLCVPKGGSCTRMLKSGECCVANNGNKYTCFGQSMSSSTCQKCAKKKQT